ncbi:MAG: oxidoreductase [Croceicoccus sp.]|nr:oxidoreductase [Croceicoccus sp.]MAL24655.1 oxidoreductase [Croceicoccus sp.]|tara:strand:- start:34447 stop:35178 length:732 start_codon:yes stop_codon:yes gene_type:complete
MSEQTDNRPLAGQLGLVTGASRGIGEATALALAEAGMHVVLTARDDRALEAVEEKIHAAGGSATIAPLDLAEPDAVARLAAAVSGRWDKLDALIINAAILPELTSVTDINAKQFSQALTVNVLATQTLLAAFHPMLKAAEAGKVIGLTSSVGANPRAYWGAYGASKAAFDTLLSCYAQENEKVSRIATAIVDPGATRTAMRARAFPGEDPNSVKLPEVVAQEILCFLREGFVNGTKLRVSSAS